MTIFIAALAALGQMQAAPTPGSAEMAPYLPLAGEGLCRTSPRGEELLDGLLSYDHASGKWKATRPLPLPDGRRGVTRITVDSIKDVEGAEEAVSTTTLPEGVTWHGMPLTHVTIKHVSVPESDDSDWRSMTFAVPASELRARLLSLGDDTPLAPLYREIPGGDDRCDGAASIEPDGKNSSLLTCNWGC